MLSLPKKDKKLVLVSPLKLVALSPLSKRIAQVSKKNKQSGNSSLYFDQQKVAHNRYQLIELIGEGGTGAVYRAKDKLLGLDVAVKIFDKKFTRNPEIIKDFLSEAKITMSLTHPNLIRVHNFEKSNQNYYLVMEYIQGHSLDKHEKKFDESTMQIILGCSKTLDYTHKHRVIHRDLKPSNIMISNNGVLKIIDFGIANFLNLKYSDDFIMGTPIYMSPEQIRGEKLDQRTDVYSLGLVAYELMTGKTVYPPNLAFEDLATTVRAEFTGLPGEMIGFLNKATCVKLEDRISCMEVFSKEFESLRKRYFGS